jgi:VWFA-related protein
MPRLFLILFIPFLLFSALDLKAQDDDPIRVESAIVRVNVGVLDQRGRPITSLARTNFDLFEDGVKQEITRFEATTSPFSVVMLLDMSGSTMSFRQNIRLSASRFLDALAPEDRISVIEFHSRIRVLNDFTPDKRRAAHSISVANGRGDTDLYKAIEFALDRLQGEKTSRKAIVLLTDGIDTAMQNADRDTLADLTDEEIPNAIDPGSSLVLERVLTIADNQGVTIYPLGLPTGDPKRLADPTPRQVEMYRAARERLQILADRTGGTLNAIMRLEEMGRLYYEVAADIRTLYTIEYSPTNLTRDGKWRTIKVEVNRPELMVRSRQGYFAR